jgi:hypothetical protein
VAPSYSSFIASSEAEAITRTSDGYLEWCPDSKVVSAANVLWLPLGELLVERGLLSNVQLELALGEQRRTGLRLGEVLVSMGFVSEEALARMLLEQVGLSSTAEERSDPSQALPQPPPEPEVEHGVAVVWERPADDEPEAVADHEPEAFIEPEPQTFDQPHPEAFDEREPRASDEPEAEPFTEQEAVVFEAPAPAPETEAEPEPAPEPAAQPPLRVSRPGEGASGEPGGSPERTSAPEPELRIAFEAHSAPERAPEPVIVRMDDPGRGRGRWWSRNGNKARVRELEKVLSDFEQRSRAIEADIMRVRTTLRNLRDEKPRP